MAAYEITLGNGPAALILVQPSIITAIAAHLVGIQSYKPTVAVVKDLGKWPLPKGLTTNTKSHRIEE